jgi:hypothetical protein
MSDEQSRDRANPASFTIQEWCQHRRISPAMFYKLDGQGLAPRTHFAGKRRLISGDADLEWVRAREAEAAEAETNTAA